MTKIDLITGFLGSGKTTFLIGYVNYLLSQGKRVCILEFDYGAVNVDMMLLQEFNDRCDLEMVAGGCDYDCHLRRFKTKLIAMGMKKYDRVIVEPSGIFDPDEFFDTLYEDPLCDWYEIGSVISVIDPGIADNLSKESKYILISQLAASGLYIFSKTQNYNKAQIENAISYVAGVMDEYKMELNKNLIYTKPFASYDANDYEKFTHAGYQQLQHEKESIIEKNSFDSVYLLNPHLTLEKIKKAASVLFKDEKYGKIIRIKGFIHENDKWNEFNMTAKELNISPLLNGQDVIIIIGENLHRENIQSLFD